MMATQALQQTLPAWEDSVIDQVLWEEHNPPGVVPKSGRKQHRSCDQCRKGKKGCDAVIPKDFGNYLADSNVEGWRRGTFPLGPCSNCTKTGKDCTFVWLFSQERGRIRRTNDGPGPSSKRAKLRAIKNQFDTSPMDNISSDGARERLNIFPASSSSVKKMRHQDHGQRDLSSVTLEQSARPPSRQREWDFDDISEEDSVFASPETFSSGSQSWNRRTSYGEETNQPLPFSNVIWCEPVATEPFCEKIVEGTSNPMGYSSSATSGISHTRERQAGTSRQRKRPVHIPADISPFSIPENLATFTNKSFMTENLMKVYHDSMENALSCWLTERTCPYGNRASTSDGAGSIDLSMLHEWGPDWSNRICRQVISLDRKSAVIRNTPLTRFEEKAASNALNLAIMAFATQWSQSSERSRAKFQPVNTNKAPWEQSNDLINEARSTGYTSHHVDDFIPPAMEFDRIIQETLWAQAKRAIQDATHIESFRVVFAHLIFALTQRPLSVDQYFPSPRSKVRKASPRSLHTTLSPESEDNEYDHSVSVATYQEEHRRLIREIEDVIDRDGPPIFLEQGLRHIHALRCKVDEVETQQWKSKVESGRIHPGVDSTSAQLSQEDRKTVDLLYWLGVMFDTLSAAIHKRSLVVSDEDSDVHLEPTPNPNCLRQHDLSSESRQVPLTEQNIPYRLKSTSASKLWSVFFFQDQTLRNRAPPIRWPCSYQSAAAALADAAPIKVLLFRKLTRIQTLISRHIRGEQLEEAIKDALYVYRYWNAVYGPFILDCVAHHDQLPARIQSWYICLTGHWYLAVLLLADTIQIIDTDCQLGLESYRRRRESCGLVTALRQRTSHAVANLARCSCPREDASFPDAGEFHFAVNQGALLTEPWTQVLIRVFAKAGALLLADAAISQYGTDSEKSCKQVLECSESCVQALWYLGRKSDMAFIAAEVLTRALEDARVKMVTVEVSRISEEYFEPGFSMHDDSLFPVLSAGTDDFTQISGDAKFGSLEEDAMQNFHVDLMGVDDFESFI